MRCSPRPTIGLRPPASWRPTPFSRRRQRKPAASRIPPGSPISRCAGAAPRPAWIRARAACGRNSSGTGCRIGSSRSPKRAGRRSRSIACGIDGLSPAAALRGVTGRKSGRLHSPSVPPIYWAGGWRWTSHSPTGSGPEGSSPNELRFGSLVSLPPSNRHTTGTRRGAAGTMNDATTPDDSGTPALGLGTPQRGSNYRVLARKYRPASFADLIGQVAMVRTISNAFETGRIPQAWILTGVRGVGKTTTARILARALNYELPDGSVKGPTIHMPKLGVHCQAIMESRHMDVLEMDAASHTGVDDVRQINDSVRYAPASARYKVYIIDEVHMLSTAAFNAFLKTLEEPPEHAKFVFATTEIRKVPVTVLSRCQRFDLRRVEADVLMKHLANIATKEGVEVEPEALGIIARAAEGSVRDSLSLFDQAIAHAAGTVRADAVRQMLGLADRTRVIDLFDSLADRK